MTEARAFWDEKCGCSTSMGPAILCDACPRPDRYERRASSGKPNRIRPLASRSATFVPVWLRRVVGQSLVKTFPLRLGDPIAILGEHYPAPHEWFRLAALTALSRAIEHVRVHKTMCRPVRWPSRSWRPNRVRGVPAEGIAKAV